MIKLGNFYVMWDRFFNKSFQLVTKVQVFDKDKKYIRSGIVVKSERDTHNKEISCKKALARALTLSDVPKSERRKIWEAYRTMPKKGPRWNDPIADSTILKDKKIKSAELSA